jgi:hypothetical protein
MKTYIFMYALIWVSLIQILVILFPVLSTRSTVDIHAVIGLVVVGLAFMVARRVAKTLAPERIKRLTRVTAILGAIQVLLGLALYAAVVISVSISSTVFNLILFIHVVNAIAIISQASSAATAFDMWEEKEFVQVESTAR